MSPELLNLINNDSIDKFKINDLEKNNIFSFGLILL